jgi:hypothetical protein
MDLSLKGFSTGPGTQLQVWFSQKCNPVVGKSVLSVQTCVTDLDAVTGEIDSGGVQECLQVLLQFWSEELHFC